MTAISTGRVVSAIAASLISGVRPLTYISRAWLWALTAAGVCLILAFAAPPAFSQEPPECVGIDRIVALVQEDGGELIDLVDVRSDTFDQLLIMRKGNALVIGGAKDGCVLTNPIVVDSVAPVTGA